MAFNQSGLQAALDKFLGSKDFRAGIISATRGKRQNSRYTLELLPEGRYLVLLDSQVGNKSDEPEHIFLDLPVLDDKDLTLWSGSEESYFISDFNVKQTDLIRQLQDQFNRFF